LKSQTVRLLDVFVVGPVLVYAGTRFAVKGGCAVEKHAPGVGMAVAAIGVATVVYNGRNYLRLAK